MVRIEMPKMMRPRVQATRRRASYGNKLEGNYRGGVVVERPRNVFYYVVSLDKTVPSSDSSPRQWLEIMSRTEL